MSINIAGTQPIDDPEYRYKMPKLVGKIEGRGNGIKTVVVNCVDIATSLHRHPGEVCKFFGCELGAQSKFDPETERAVVNGAFDTNSMQEHLSKYIELFVLCPSCRLPETKYKFKGQTISHKCLACGAIEPVDMRHKLTTFILKERAAEKRKGKDKDDKKKKRREKKEKGDEPSPNDKKEKKKKDKKEKKKKKEKDDSADPVDDNVEWHTDLSKEAVEARMQEAHAIEEAARKAMENDGEVVATLENMTVDDSGAIETAVNAVKAFMSKYPSTEAAIEEVCNQQRYSALPSTSRAVIFLEAVCNANVIKDNQIHQYADILVKLVNTTEDQMELLAFCEHFCAIKYSDLLPSFPVMLKFLYDDDILEEESIVAWVDPAIRSKYALTEVPAATAQQLLRSLQPFIEWLQNAEEESDDED